MAMGEVRYRLAEPPGGRARNGIPRHDVALPV